MRLLVAGSRSITNAELVEDCINNILEDLPQVDSIISGMASGVDTIAANYCKEVLGYQSIEFPVSTVQWKMEHNQAGHNRNSRMIRIADYALIIWDGESKGTKDTLRKVKALGIPYNIYSTKEKAWI